MNATYQVTKCRKEDINTQNVNEDDIGLGDKHIVRCNIEKQNNKTQNIKRKRKQIAKVIN